MLPRHRDLLIWVRRSVPWAHRSVPRAHNMALWKPDWALGSQTGSPGSNKNQYLAPRNKSQSRQKVPGAAGSSQEFGKLECEWFSIGVRVPQAGISRSETPTASRAGACREGKGRVPLPLVVVDRRHRGLGGYSGTEPSIYTP